jgi:8-oxo-dGTP pyrophosphatase MutT (NUDIX family)
MRSHIGHEQLMLQAATAMIFDDAGRMLLVRSIESGEWLTIGGAIDPEEHPADAAVRECWEELGILVEPTELMGVFGGPEFRVTYPNGDVVSYLTILFKARIVGGTPKPDGVEIAEMRYFTREECAGLTMNSATRVLIGCAFEYDGRPWFEPAGFKPVQRAK